MTLDRPLSGIYGDSILGFIIQLKLKRFTYDCSILVSILWSLSLDLGLFHVGTDTFAQMFIHLFIRSSTRVETLLQATVASGQADTPTHTQTLSLTDS